MNPVLNYTSPLHTFSAGNLSYTATKECYICGTMSPKSTDLNTLTVNGTVIAQAQQGGTNNVYGVRNYVAPLKIKAGDIVAVVGACNYLHIFEAIS